MRGTYGKSSHLYRDAGGGHISAANAIKGYLETEHHITIITLFRQVLGWVDPIQLLTLQRFSLDNWYNYFVRKKYHRMINLIALFGVYSFFFLRPLIEWLILNCLKKEKPDIIISVVPVLNGAIGAVAQKLNIPFIVVPTDLNTWWVTRYLYAKTYKNFLFTLFFNDPMIWQQFT